MSDNQRPRCVFCGDNDTYVTESENVPGSGLGNGIFFVECGNCGARGPFADDELEARRLWGGWMKYEAGNRRINP